MTSGRHPPASSSCPVCGGSARLAYVARDLNRRIGEVRFHYLRCGLCGLVFLDDVPADLSPYYPPSYYPLHETVEELREASRFEQFKLDFVHLSHRSGRLLEIGPGAGGFALLASEADFEVSVLEMPGPSADWIEDRLKVSVHLAEDPLSVLPTLGQFDVITLWHSWEHLRDPWGMLDAAAAALSEGGSLIIATPNPDSLQMRVFGARWTHLDAPRHLVLSPPEVLVLAWRSEGSASSTLRWPTARPAGWNRFGWEHSLGNLSRYPAFSEFVVYLWQSRGPRVAELGDALDPSKPCTR